MYGEERLDTFVYKVVVNHEEQFSIWPANRENPKGWFDAGKIGPKTDCLSYIKEVWTDMRPLSLRNRMAELAQQPRPEFTNANQNGEIFHSTATN